MDREKLEKIKEHFHAIMERREEMRKELGDERLKDLTSIAHFCILNGVNPESVISYDHNDDGTLTVYFKNEDKP